MAKKPSVADLARKQFAADNKDDGIRWQGEREGYRVKERLTLTHNYDKRYTVQRLGTTGKWTQIDEDDILENAIHKAKTHTPDPIKQKARFSPRKK